MPCSLAIALGRQYRNPAGPRLGAGTICANHGFGKAPPGRPVSGHDRSGNVADYPCEPVHALPAVHALVRAQGL
eukprot:5588785-Alexandrium_andersonii.AAC.1